MDNNGLSASDVAMLANGNGFGDNFMWIFGLLILMGMFNGGFGWGGNGYAPQYATQDFVQNGFNFNDLQDQNRDILNAITGGTAQAVAASNQAKYDNINVMKDVQMDLANQISDVKQMEQNILGNQNDCCCSTKMLIAENAANTNAQIAQSKYDTSMQIAGLEQRLNAKLDQNKIEALQDQVNQLRLDRATEGMLRFPNQWAYGAGQFPPIFGNCYGQANI